MKKGQVKKAQKTLEKMKKLRYEDTLFLRDIIAKKLSWAEKERLIGLAKIADLKSQINRLEGVILFIKDLQTAKKEEKK